MLLEIRELIQTSFNELHNLARNYIFHKTNSARQKHGTWGERNYPYETEC